MKGLVDAISKIKLNTNDILLIGRGGGNIGHESFNAFKSSSAAPL